MNIKLESIALFCFIAIFAFLLKFLTNSLNEKLLNETVNETNWLKNWNDYVVNNTPSNSTELGEEGKPADIEVYRVELYKEYGYDALLSDHISINRSVPDVRPEDCKKMKYLAHLPKTAIIITFFNERLSVLLRTVYGIVNRTPKELIEEIILVDDCSTFSELHFKLTEFLRIHLSAGPVKVRLIRSQRRVGLIAARMIGAKAASKKSNVYMFMDSHFEVSYNWLPPLLEPIAINSRVCTCPAFDSISFKSFEYIKNDAFRGYFDWTLGYKFFPIHSHEYRTPAKNRRDFILAGGAITISAEFFWTLGGFDEGMNFWGGEQFELSFKIWMCGGEIIQVPCSRMAHLYRDSSTKGNRNLYGNYKFLEKNFRRLIEVWMDEEHRQYVFDRRPAVKNADPGDLTDRFAIRDRLQCKSFSWMMDNIMPEIKESFPPIEPKALATGHLQSIWNPKLCIALTKDRIILEPCSIDIIEKNQNFTYTFRGEFCAFGAFCLESDITNGRVGKWSCHLMGGNQKWYYDRETQWITQKEHNVCMLASVEDRLVKLAPCDRSNASMKWTISHMYEDEMKKWENKLNKS